MASSSTAILQPSTSNHSVEKINVACRFYGLGACRFGDTCRYLHGEGKFGLLFDKYHRSISILFLFLSSFLAESSNVINNNNTLSSTSSSSSFTNSLNPQAPIFVPTFKKEFNPNDPPKSYADVVNANRVKEQTWMPPVVDESMTLCPFMMKSGFCRYETCAYAHGEMCELCQKFCLDPLDSEQRKKHNSECIAAHEKEMEIAFSIQRSKEKTCGICFDVVWEKDGREQRFGILPNCNHCFCLECIRTWRQAKQFDNKIIRACPECRTCSDFVCPSSFWVDNPEEKEQLITKYKSALSEKDCKYFKRVRFDL
jgi:E3 ubiquitin-protein ligase makorin